MSDGPAVFVRFRVPGQGAWYRPGSLVVRPGERVLCETERGPFLGAVVARREAQAAARELTRVATRDDERVAAQHVIREREAFTFCVQAIRSHGLPMKLVSVEITQSGTRAIFNFTSDDRVDFRGLVKDLARRFHSRIEMRQIGVRDAARFTGGLGLCGRELCCSTWLPVFQPISIRMAKDQNLGLNQDKLSGLCGRLRCCLQYEQELYEDQRKGLPKLGKRVLTPMGEGRVKEVNVLRQRVRVQHVDGRYGDFAASELDVPADVLEQQEHQRAVEAAPELKRKRKRRKKKAPGGAQGGGPGAPPGTT